MNVFASWELKNYRHKQNNTSNDGEAAAKKNTAKFHVVPPHQSIILIRKFLKPGANTKFVTHKWMLWLIDKLKWGSNAIEIHVVVALGIWSSILCRTQIDHLRGGTHINGNSFQAWIMPNYGNKNYSLQFHLIWVDFFCSKNHCQRKEIRIIKIAYSAEISIILIDTKHKSQTNKQNHSRKCVYFITKTKQTQNQQLKYRSHANDKYNVISEQWIVISICKIYFVFFFSFRPSTCQTHNSNQKYAWIFKG